MSLEPISVAMVHALDRLEHAHDRKPRTELTHQWHRDKHTTLPHIPEGTEVVIQGNIDGNAYTLPGPVYYGSTDTPWVGGQSLTSSENGRPWFDIISVTWRAES